MIDQASRSEAAIQLVLAEFRRITAIHPPYNSSHEAFGVLQEEVDEYFDEVKLNREQTSIAEAVQIAAVALRIVAERARFLVHEDGSGSPSLVLAPTEAQEAMKAAERLFSGLCGMGGQA